MNVLFTTQPGMGHLRPLATLARGLTARGHDVRVACAPRLASLVESLGLRPIPAGYDFTMAEASRAFPDMPAAGPARMPWMIPFFYRRTAVRTAKDLVASRGTFRPDLVVRDYLELGGALYGELSGIPHVAAGPIWFRGEPAVMESLRGACEDLGIGATRAEDVPFRYGAFAAQPPSWNAPNEIVPPNVTYVRPEAPPATGPAPGWLSEIPGEATVVHVTLGTTEANRTPGLYRTILDALRDEPVEVVVSVGRPFVTDELGPVAPNIHLHELVEHGHLLPRCSVVVSNAGYGTLMASLACGVPGVVVPIQADQPRNAARAADLGFAVSVPRPEWSVDAIRSAVRSVLGDARYRAAAIRAKVDIERLPSIEEIIPRVEALAKNAGSSG
jgi:UDP:flavonoid glycosyltransferase YjiC (YdhE family)